MTTPQPDASPDTIRATSAALARAALFDDYFANKDVARLAAWSEAVEIHKLEEHHLLGAVTAFYAATPQGRLGIGDLIRLGRDARRDDAERESREDREARQVRNDRRHGLTVGDPALGELPIAGADGPPVPGAYEVNGAVDRVCSFCGAEPMHSCVETRTGNPRRMPCLARLKDGRPAA